MGNVSMGAGRPPRLGDAVPVLIVQAVVAEMRLPVVDRVVQDARGALRLAIVARLDDAPLEGAVEPAVHV